MQTRQVLRSLYVAATIAALHAAGAMAADAPARKNAATVGEALAKAANERDVDAFMRHVDTVALVRLVLRDLGLGESDAEALRQHLPASVRNNVATGMRALEQGKASVRFVRDGREDGRAYALLRMDMAEGGVDYVKYFLSPRHAVEDWYIYTSAALFSTQVRFNLATMLKSDSILSAVFGMRALSRSDLKPFSDMRARVAADDYAGAYRALEGFPESYRKSRQWALMRVTYGGRAGDDAYRAALRHLAANFGSDNDLQLILIDHYVYEQQLDKSLAAIAGLELAFGGEDASISSLRGNLLSEMKRYPEAAQACRRAIAQEPDFKQGYWCLISVGTSSNDGKVAVEGLTAYEKAFNLSFDPDKLAAKDAYKEIARTREFAAWAKARRR
jgi:tetratricopeptide (TPR) repeat protein